MSALGTLLKRWDWGLFGLIFLYMALPQVYRSYSIYLIGNAIPDTGALATVAQWQFVELFLEVVQETFVLAIFFFVGKSAQDNLNPGYPIRTAYTVIFFTSLVIAALLFGLSGSFVNLIGTPDSLQATTGRFLQIKALSIPVLLLSAATVVMVETINRKKLLLTMALLSVLYRGVFDSLFYGGYFFSLDLGVLGVAWSDLAAALALLVTLLYLIRSLVQGTMRTWISFFTLQDWRTYVGVGAGSGLDSLVRNVAYFFMIVRLLNMLGGEAIGGYYLAMHIFWSFLLVPILALSESAKVLIAKHSGDLRQVRALWYSATVIGCLVIGVWLVLVPFWQSFARFLNPNESYVEFSVKTLSILLLPYMLLALNLVSDSIFYGVGRTRYMAYQAIITNGTVYGTAFVAYLLGWWSPTFTTILLLFSLGILVDSGLTVFYALRVLFPQFHTPLQRKIAIPGSPE